VLPGRLSPAVVARSVLAAKQPPARERRPARRQKTTYASNRISKGRAHTIRLDGHCNAVIWLAGMAKSWPLLAASDRSRAASFGALQPLAKPPPLSPAENRKRSGLSD